MAVEGAILDGFSNVFTSLRQRKSYKGQNNDRKALTRLESKGTGKES